MSDFTLTPPKRRLGLPKIRGNAIVMVLNVVYSVPVDLNI